MLENPIIVKNSGHFREISGNLIKLNDKDTNQG